MSFCIIVSRYNENVEEKIEKMKNMEKIENMKKMENI